MIGLQYAYLVGCLLFGTLFWLPLYVARPALRREMLFMSILSAPLGLITTLFFLHDYWHPLFAVPQLFALEDFLFSFFVGGFAGAVYQGVFGKLAVPRPRYKRAKIAAMVVVGLATMYVGTTVLGYNSIYVATALLLVLGGALVVGRPGRLPGALFAALATAAAMLVMYQLWFALFPQALLWWDLHNLSGILVGGTVPLEELLWGGAWGFFAASLFEFVAGSRYIQKYGTRTNTDRAIL